MCIYNRQYIFKCSQEQYRNLSHRTSNLTTLVQIQNINYMTTVLVDVHISVHINNQKYENTERSWLKQKIFICNILVRNVLLCEKFYLFFA